MKEKKDLQHIKGAQFLKQSAPFLIYLMYCICLSSFQNRNASFKEMIPK